MKMEKKNISLSKKKLSKRRVTAPGTLVCSATTPFSPKKKFNNVTLAQATLSENKPRHKQPKKSNLKVQKRGETDKENSTELLNDINLNATFEIESAHFDQTSNEAYKKISTDSDIEFSDKMKQRKQVTVEKNNTGFEPHIRKSVRFMPTKTLICSPYMNADGIENMTPKKLEDINERKSTPFVKRSKNSVITIDSTTTTDSDVSMSWLNHHTSITSLASQSSTTPVRPSTKRYGLRSSSINTEKTGEDNTAASIPHDRSLASEGSAAKSIVCDKPKKKSRNPQKWSCIDLVTPNCSKAERSLKREGTFLVDSPSIVVMNNTMSKIQESFSDANSTKRQRKKWDKSLGDKSLGAVVSDNSGFGLLGEKASPKENKAERQRKRWDKSLGENSGFSLLENEASPLWEEPSPPWYEEFSTGNREVITGRQKYCSSTPLHHSRAISVKAISPQKVIPEETKKKTSKVPVKSKIPNFALIHQKNFQKMENIKELVERKAKRAELLLSGQKPSRVVGSPKDRSIRKHLNYSPKKKSSAGVTANGVSKTIVDPLTKTNNMLIGVQKVSKPVIKKMEAVKYDANVLKPTKRRSIENQKNGFTKFGFKVGQEAVKKVSKDEQAKAVATKTKVGATTTDKRRILTHNVRTNRRFELLMQMRNKDK